MVGCAWQEGCVVWSVHDRDSTHGRGNACCGACMGGCVAGETATVVGREHPTGMHSCFLYCLN